MRVFKINKQDKSLLKYIKCQVPMKIDLFGKKIYFKKIIIDKCSLITNIVLKDKDNLADMDYLHLANCKQLDLEKQNGRTR